MKRFLFLLPLLFVLGCLPTPPPVPPPPPWAEGQIAPYVGEGPMVGMLGDSITWASASIIRGTLTSYRASVTGNYGRTTLQSQSWFETYYASPPQVFVVELGTNDITHQLKSEPTYTTALYGQRISAIASAFASSCVVFVTVGRLFDDTVGWNPIADSYNVFVRAQPHVADWSAALTGHPEYLVDHVHPSGPGANVLAGLIRDQVDACASTPTTEPPMTVEPPTTEAPTTEAPTTVVPTTLPEETTTIPDETTTEPDTTTTTVDDTTTTETTP